MHELFVAENLLTLALRHAEGEDATQIVRLNLLIGDLASLVDDSLQFYWDILSEGTIAQGASLNIIRVPGRMRCLECGADFQMRDRYDFECVVCGAHRTRVAAGDEFILESIDVETVEKMT